MRTIWVLAVCALSNSLTAAPQGEPSLKFKAMFEKACSACHTADSATAARRTREQWKNVVEEMVSGQGAKVADDEFEPILEYLAAAFGKVNVNTAPAAEIAQITGLPAPQAESIVSFRKEKGKFSDFDALSKVPGLDLKQLEKNRAALSF